MARKATDKVIEHRITFGDLERREFKQSMDAYQRNMNVTAGINAGRAVLYTGAAAGIGIVGYIGIKLYAALNDDFQTISDYWNNFWNAVNGTKDEVDPETGETTTVPNTVTSPTGNTFVGQDPERTGEIKNPIAGWPVVGGLFWLGMKAGELSLEGLKSQSGMNLAPY